MSREDLVWILGAALLLALGFLAGQHWAVLNDEPASGSASLLETNLPDGTGDSFRVRFWQDRSLDLAVQAVLIMVGALSIAALLPRGVEDETR